MFDELIYFKKKFFWKNKRKTKTKFKFFVYQEKTVDYLTVVVFRNDRKLQDEIEHTKEVIRKR